MLDKTTEAVQETERQRTTAEGLARAEGGHVHAECLSRHTALVAAKRDQVVRAAVRRLPVTPIRTIREGTSIAAIPPRQIDILRPSTCQHARHAAGHQHRQMSSHRLPPVLLLRIRIIVAIFYHSTIV